MKKILRIVETFISVLLITLASLLSFSIAWMFKTWTNLSMEELVFHLEVPLEGTNEDMIIEYIRSCAVPTVIIFLAAMVMIAAYRKKKEYSIIVRGAMICSLAIMVVGISYTWKELDIGNYIKNQNNDSNFIEQYYVNPEETSLTFPETKRNLIYIFLESMETTYSDHPEIKSIGTIRTIIHPIGSADIAVSVVPRSSVGNFLRLMVAQV